MNSVILVGRVGKVGVRKNDGEGTDDKIIYFEKTGNAKSGLSLAVNRWSSASKEEVTDWYNVELWNKQAEFTSEYVKVGDLVSVEGRLAMNKWTASDGTPHERPIVVANKIQIVSKKRTEQQ